MAKAGEDDVEYESDPEEEKRLLGMRRREAASDDEEGEAEEKPRIDRRAPIHSDESDGQGGAADYDDEDEELEVEEEEVYEDEEEDGVYEDYEEQENGTHGFVGGKEGNKERGIDGELEVKEKEVEARKVEEGAEPKVLDNDLEDGEEEEEDAEGKKDIEPFAVPTAGAFYMHDDRFRDDAGGRNRRTYGGRKLWESKDDKKWGHDKFEEMNLQERHYDQGRRPSKGQYQGRCGKNQAPDRGYAKRNKGKTFSNGENVNQPPKGVRGRGPRKYENRWKRSGQAPPTQHKQPEKSFERTSHGSSGRAYTPASNTESDNVPPARKHSSLSSASPPFYPSASSSKDITQSQKRDVQTGSISRNHRASAVDESFSMQQAVRGKAIADSVGVDKLYIDDSVSANAGKSLNNMQTPSSGSSLVNTMQASQSRTQGRGIAVTAHMSYQSTPLQIQANKVSSAAQPPGQRNPVQNRVQSSIQPSAQQLGQRSGSGSQASSPPKTALSINSYEPGDVETSSESSKSTGALVGKGKGTGRGSFVYGGAQVMGAAGNLAVSRGDQNFPGTPAFLPVMQFGGQHPGGLGVPAVGMAFPGYVAQPQLGLGNSEMTWLPVLAGAAGALGATYCSPYIAMDGSYHARPSGQTSSVGSSSKESNANKSNNEPSNRPEPVNDEFGQRQKPCRYSEMDFKQPSTSA
ncbi:protein MLN51 homolog [Euphorbia lathyris]|uniref:protein MLN51 homolog n=1 Tax=Euphorbia lathyris TaxID=212925 RepID=UPI0033131066